MGWYGRRIAAFGIAVGLLTGLAGCGGGGGQGGAGSTPAPVADFSPSGASGAAPLTVSFRDASTGTVTSRTWTFGDGGTSSEVNPTHVYASPGTYTVSLVAAGPGGSDTRTRSGAVVVSPSGAGAWRFAVVGDTHVPSSQILEEMAASMLQDGVQVLLVPGDLAQGGSGANAAALQTQLSAWNGLVAPLRAAGAGVFGVRGNHEADVQGDGEGAWNAAFSGELALPANGPEGERGLSYSFVRNNALFIGLDDYVNLHHVNQAWLDQQLAALGTRPHVFVFGHEPAFKVFHADCLDADTAARDAFWSSLRGAGARTYFAGHDHFFDCARISDGDGDASNDLLQVVTGGGGGTLATQYAYNGANAAYAPVNLAHDVSNGYLLVELDGNTDADLGVSLTWKRRTVSGSTVTYVPAWTSSYAAASRLRYAVVDTGVTACFDNTGVIAAPLPGAPFYGQDGQVSGRQPAYRDNGDGTVTDLGTGLMWVQARGSRMTWDQAVAGAAACRVGGHSDWRMPTLKELYSLILFTGSQGTSMTSTTGYVPFIDTGFFGFEYGAGTTDQRVIDCQDWSGTAYLGTVMGSQLAAFGVNFADGRIKGYPRSGPNGQGAGASLFVRYVRGNPAYGLNTFRDNGDGTVSDAATGLMWSQEDSGSGLDWQDALAWVQARNAASHLGHGDWRLPNVKELQTILDYGRAPDAADATRRGPAIDPLLHCTSITNEGGAPDYPFYWSSTSFQDGTPGGYAGAYIAFGRALGWMQDASGQWRLLDVHGAGAQRSDPKSGSASAYPHGRGPQGDVIRILNHVRLVRDVAN